MQQPYVFIISKDFETLDKAEELCKMENGQQINFVLANSVCVFDEFMA